MPPLPSYVEFTRGFGTHATLLGQQGTSRPTYKDRANNERAAVRPPCPYTLHLTGTLRTTVRTIRTSTTVATVWAP